MVRPKQPTTQPTTELTYPLRAAARLTGLSPELLRAWERRYGVVVPIRTPGGTRRYRASDLERLRLVKAAVDAGLRVSQVAALDATELERISARSSDHPEARLDPVLAAVTALDGAEAQRLLSLQLSALGGARFAREIALPLLQRIGDRWAEGHLSIASEHLATAVIRSMLGSALIPSATSLLGPRILFATPAGERHELGLLSAALTAQGCGASPLYLGVDLPVEEILAAADESRAEAIALSLITLARAHALRTIRALRGGLAESVPIWVGGAACADLPLPGRVEYLESLEQFEQRVTLFGIAGTGS